MDFLGDSCFRSGMELDSSFPREEHKLSASENRTFMRERERRHESGKNYTMKDFIISIIEKA